MPHYLAHAQKEYIDKCQVWHVGHSDPGVPYSIPAESRVFCMKLLSRHKLHRLREIVQEVVPRMGEQWTKGREQLGGRAMQPAPWMWQEALCIFHDAILFDDGDEIFFHQGVASRKRGANGKLVLEYPPIDGMQVVEWKKTLATISNGGRVTWPQFVDFLRVHRVTCEACTCATYLHIRCL